MDDLLQQQVYIFPSSALWKALLCPLPSVAPAYLFRELSFMDHMTCTSWRMPLLGAALF